jgi:diadenylate cyclase
VKSEFATVGETVDLLTYIAEDVSLGFDRWSNRYVRGPSLYFVVISEVRFDSFVDPLGTNRWPVETARALPADLTQAARVATDVAFDRDGAVVVAADGTFQEQMVRVRSVLDSAMMDTEYPDWMSAKHLSALEASTREEVLAAVTLSEENGRVTVFRDGSFDDRQREELGGRWRDDQHATTADRESGGRGDSEANP